MKYKKSPNGSAASSTQSRSGPLNIYGVKKKRQIIIIIKKKKFRGRV